MQDIKTVAKKLHMKSSDLLKESLRTYMEQRLSKVEAEIFLIAKKYGVKDVFEMDEKIKEGLITENEAYDDYFTLDNLEAEREQLIQISEEI